MSYSEEWYSLDNAIVCSNNGMSVHSSMSFSSSIPPVAFPYLSKPDGSWICGFCCSVPRSCQHSSSVWKGALPPTPAFVEAHLRICPGTPVGGQTLTGTPTSNPTTPSRGSYVGPPRAHLTRIVNLDANKQRGIMHQHSPGAGDRRRLMLRPTSYHCVSCGQHFDRWTPCIEHMKDCCMDEVVKRSKRGLRKVCAGENWSKQTYQCMHCGQEYIKWARYKQHISQCGCPQAARMNYGVNVENVHPGRQTVLASARD